MTSRLHRANGNDFEGMAYALRMEESNAYVGSVETGGLVRVYPKLTVNGYECANWVVLTIYQGLLPSIIDPQSQVVISETCLSYAR